MGAVQKLATVVIIGLVALATLLVVYLADEPHRRSTEAETQKEVAINRGIADFVKFCVTCHGPAGEGASEPDAPGTGRIGGVLGGNTRQGRENTSINQRGVSLEGTPFAGGVDARAQIIRNTIENGVGCSPTGTGCVMPAWGKSGQLNGEQIDNLVTMIQNVNWNQVYNAAIAANGGKFPAPPPAAASSSGGSSASGTPGGNAGAASGGTVELDAFDIGWKQKELTIPAGTPTKVKLVNTGALAHNFSIDALHVSVDMPAGQTVETTINAPAGDYQYYCNVPGHKEAGMVGTLHVTKAPPASASNGGQAPSAAGGGQPPAAAEPEIDAYDIGWKQKEFTIPAGKATKVKLVNTGAIGHNFSIDALHISVDMPAGQTVETTITAPAGKYEYYCNVPGHKEAGMVGTMTASPNAGAAPPSGAAKSGEPAGNASGSSGSANAPAAEQALDAFDIGWKQKEIDIPTDTPVKIKLVNTGAIGHNFSIDALHVSVDMPAGQTVETTIKAPAGTYEYYCNVPGHKEAGMVGKLVVK